MIRRLEFAINGISRATLFVAIVLVLGIFAVVMLQVIFSLADSVLAWLGADPLGYFVPSYAEISGISRGVSAWLALTYALDKGRHIRIRVLLDSCSEPVKKIVEFLVMVIAFLIMLYLGFAVATGAFQAYKFGDVTVGLISIPIWTILAAMSFSIFNFCASILLHFIAAIRGQSVAYDENIENLVS